MNIFTGKVIAVKNAKTAVVEVGRTVTHPIYKKRMRKNRMYQVHDEIGVKVGDMVKFVPCRPISKTKRWKIVDEKIKGGKKI